MLKLDGNLTENLPVDSPEAFPLLHFTVKLPQDYSSVLLHWHGSMEILRVREGHGRITVDLEVTPVKKGDVCLVLPGQLQAAEPLGAGEEQLVLERFQFPLAMLVNEKSGKDVQHFFHPIAAGEQVFPWLLTRDFAGYEPFCQCLEEIGQMLTFYPLAYQLGVTAKLYQLFYILFYSEPVPSPKSRPQKSVQNTKLLLSHISAHYHEKLDIGQMAAVCGFSESHFIKFFKSVVGLTFTEYLNLFRLSKAAEMLAKTRLPILEVATLCGFGNISYFNRLFRQRYGLAPTVYRKEGHFQPGRF